MNIPPSSSEFFDAKYRETTDPWSFATSSYELMRYKAMLAALAHRRYHRAFEPGCSIGVFTEQLAGLCDEVLAVDFSPTAATLAQQRCAHLEGVTVRCASLGEQLSTQEFDLIVLSEIGYYFSPEGWAAMVERLLSPLARGRTVLATHWLGVSSDHRMSGDQVHEILRLSPLLHLEHAEYHESFRLDRWVRL